MLHSQEDKAAYHVQVLHVKSISTKGFLQLKQDVRRAPRPVVPVLHSSHSCAADSYK